MHGLNILVFSAIIYTIWYIIIKNSQRDGIMKASNTKLIHVACLVIALGFGQTAQAASCKSVKAANIEAWDEVISESQRLEKNIDNFIDIAEDALDVRTDLEDGDKSLAKLESAMKVVIPAMAMAPNVKTLMTQMNNTAGTLRKSGIQPAYETTDKAITAAKIEQIKEQLEKEVKPAVVQLENEAEDLRSFVKDDLSCDAWGEVAVECFAENAIEATTETLENTAAYMAQMNMVLEGGSVSELNKIASLEKGLKTLNAPIKEMGKLGGTLDSLMNKTIKLEHGIPNKIKVVGVKIKLGIPEPSLKLKDVVKEVGSIKKKLKNLIRKVSKKHYNKYVEKLEKTTERILETAMSPATNVVNKEMNKLTKGIQPPSINIASFSEEFGRIDKIEATLTKNIKTVLACR